MPTTRCSVTHPIVETDPFSVLTCAITLTQEEEQAASSHKSVADGYAMLHIAPPHWQPAQPPNAMASRQPTPPAWPPLAPTTDSANAPGPGTPQPFGPSGTGTMGVAAAWPVRSPNAGFGKRGSPGKGSSQGGIMTGGADALRQMHAQSMRMERVREVDRLREKLNAVYSAMGSGPGIAGAWVASGTVGSPSASSTSPDVPAVVQQALRGMGMPGRRTHSVSRLAATAGAGALGTIAEATGSVNESNTTASGATGFPAAAGSTPATGIASSAPTAPAVAAFAHQAVGASNGPGVGRADVHECASLCVQLESCMSAFSPTAAAAAGYDTAQGGTGTCAPARRPLFSSVGPDGGTGVSSGAAHAPLLPNAVPWSGANSGDMALLLPAGWQLGICECLEWERALVRMPMEERGCFNPGCCSLEGTSLAGACLLAACCGCDTARYCSDACADAAHAAAHSHTCATWSEEQAGGMGGSGGWHGSPGAGSLGAGRVVAGGGGYGGGYGAGGSPAGMGGGGNRQVVPPAPRQPTIRVVPRPPPPPYTSVHNSM